MRRALWSLLLSLGLAFPALAGPISSTVSLQADANAGAGTVTDTDSQSQGATINTLVASVNALAVNGNASVATFGSAIASWVNPNVGSLVLSDFGWETIDVSFGSAFLTGGLDYSYTFVADGTGTFTLNYSITGSGSNVFGLNGVNYDFNGNQIFLDLDTNGTLTESVVAGNTYTLTLRNQANISGGLGTRDAHMDAVFDFNAPAEAVPEPSSVILLATGCLGLAGWHRRRARQAVTS